MQWLSARSWLFCSEAWGSQGKDYVFKKKKLEPSLKIRYLVGHASMRIFRALVKNTERVSKKVGTPPKLAPPSWNTGLNGWTMVYLVRRQKICLCRTVR